MKKDDGRNKLIKFLRKNMVWIVIIASVLVYAYISGGGVTGKTTEDKSQTKYVSYEEFSNMVANKEISYVFSSSGSSTIQFLPTNEYLQKKGVVLTEEYLQMIDSYSKSKETSIDEKLLPKEGRFKYVTENPGSDTFRESLLKQGIRVFSVRTSQTMSIILSLVLNLLPFIILLGFMFNFQRRLEPADNELVTDVPDTKFSNIAGYETLKNDSKFILDFLKNPKAYEKIGARLPNGVLFYGPPGTGKTLMARAIAGEASVPFYKVNGSDFVELYVGLGARRVRNLYKTARENAPCIVFIDEVDSIGGARGGFKGSSEDDKTLTALLNELDGFSAKKGVITIAATNRLQDLDPALVRPGRFDRHVAVPLPNKEERLEILDLYKNGKKLSPSIDIEKLASKTIGFSPSELENLLNESAIKAVTRGSEVVEQQDLDDSFLKIIIKGDKKEDKYQSEKEKKIIAYHEAGHAIVGHMLGKPILEVSIIGTTSGAGGYTLSQPKEGLRSKMDMKNEVKELYGGRAGETMIVESDDEITIGAVSDIEQATKIISNYIKILGLNGSLINLEELGMRRPNDEIIEQAKQISSELFEETVAILKANRRKLDKLAEILLDKSIVDADSFLKIMNETKEDGEIEEVLETIETSNVIEEDIEDGDNSPSKLQGLKDKLSNLNDDLLSQKKLF
ncbi:cell division protease FtsH [[Eubacterium] yurii]|jgi:cell division protein|nr:cell division protease FtsH [[Eubacterium] yurii]